jgi:adenylate cyclase
VPREIERKFLVANDGWRVGADRGRSFRQAYLAETDRAAIRVRISDGKDAVVTIKSARAGLSRSEFEYAVPVADAEAMTELRQGSVLQKTRFRAPHAGRTWEVDVYDGENAGLVIAEIEIESETATVDLPPWLGREVTGERRFYAAQLAQHPFRSWGEAERAGALVQ